MIPLLVGAGLAAGATAADLYNSYKNREAAKKAYDEIVAKSDAVTAQNQADIDRFLSGMYGTYGEGAGKYNEALANFLNSEVYQNKDFTYGDQPGQTIESFFDPAANQRVAAAMSAIENASATGGNRFSSDYLNQVAAKQQALASEEWEKAYKRLMQDRQQQMSEWSANSQNAWNNYNANNERARYAVDLYGNDRDKLMQGTSEAIMAGMNNRTANLQTQANAMGGIANSNMGNNAGGYAGGALNAISSFLGNYYK